MGSVMTNKYAEGTRQALLRRVRVRDVAEELARARAKQLFGADHVNVQPHSGAQANMSVYLATCQPGDTILGLDLSHGGHLTHGHPLNYSGKTFKVVPYLVRPDTETIDYDALRELARTTSRNSSSAARRPTRAPSTSSSSRRSPTSRARW